MSDYVHTAQLFCHVPLSTNVVHFPPSCSISAINTNVHMHKIWMQIHGCHYCTCYWWWLQLTLAF